MRINTRQRRRRQHKRPRPVNNGQRHRRPEIISTRPQTLPPLHNIIPLQMLLLAVVLPLMLPPPPPPLSINVAAVTSRPLVVPMLAAATTAVAKRNVNIKNGNIKHNNVTNPIRVQVRPSSTLHPCHIPYLLIWIFCCRTRYRFHVTFGLVR